MKIFDKYPWLVDYLLSKAGAESDFKAEWQWTRFMIKGKMFAAFCADESECPLITVKCEPDFNFELRNTFPDIIPGYYMNKVHWNSIKVNGDVPDNIIKEMCDRGYNLILKSLPKKVREEVLTMERNS